MTKEERNELRSVAADMLQGRKFLSPYAEDNLKTTPKRVLRQAEVQREQLRQWACKIIDLINGARL